jgi:hypothetical protein
VGPTNPICRLFCLAILALVGLTLLATPGLAAAEGRAKPARTPLTEAGVAGSAWDALLRDGRHDRFLRLVEQAKLRKVLDGREPITVFAPTDAAIAAVRPAELARLTEPENWPELRAFIGRHLLWGAVTPEEVQGLMLRSTLARTAVHLSPEPPESTDEAVPGDDATPAIRADDRLATLLSPDPGENVIYTLDEVLDAPEEARPLRHAPACDNRDKPSGGSDRARGSNNGSGAADRAPPAKGSRESSADRARSVSGQEGAPGDGSSGSSDPDDRPDAKLPKPRPEPPPPCCGGG